MTKNLVTNGGSLLAYAKNESNEHLGMQLGSKSNETPDFIFDTNAKSGY
jgi:hypothetical protein